MNIFYYFPERDTIMNHWQRDHFVEELSHHNIKLQLFNPLLYSSWDEANDQALKTVKSGDFDIFFTDVCDSKVLYIETLSEIKKLGIPTLCFRCDNLVIPLYDKEMAPLFDLIWLTSIETKRFYDKWGANTCFAPYAANPFVFKYFDKECIRRVCFVGTPYGSRARMFNTLTKGGVDLTLFFGNTSKETINKWDHFDTVIEEPKHSHIRAIYNRTRFKEGRTLILGSIKNKIMGNGNVENNTHLLIKQAVPPSDLSQIYSEYVLSLASTSAHHTDVLNNPLKIVNLRNFEIPMSGGVEICRFNEEMANYFEENKEIIFYRSNEEFVDKALFFTTKASEKNIIDIRMAARKRAEIDHTWYIRFKTVLNALGISI